MSDRTQKSSDAFLAVAVCVLLAAAVGLVFGRTARYQFINLDDTVCVYMNPHVAGGLTLDGVKWVFTHFCGGTYTPVTLVTHMLDCQLYGLNAGGHHLTNVLLHAATTILLFLVLQRMTGRLWPSSLVAAIFAVHPLRVESVAWIVERKDVLSGFFFVLALGAYLRFTRAPFSIPRYLTLLVLFVLGLLSKPMLVTLPFVLLLLDYWPLGRFATTSSRRLILEKLPLVALTVVSCLVTVQANDNEGVDALLDPRFSLWWRLKNVPISYVDYIGMLFYPTNLALPYPRPAFALSPWKVWGAALALAAITAAALAAWRKRPYLAVGWLWYLGMLTPVSGFLLFEMHGTTMLADRFTYLPQIGLSIAIVWGLADILRVAPFRRLAYGAAAALSLATLLVLMVLAWRQAAFWRDNETLWKHSLACTSRNRMAHHALGNAFLAQGKIYEAIEQYRAAIAIESGYAIIHHNLGVALAAAGRIDLAAEQYRLAVQLDPGDAAAQNNLGRVLLSRGQVEEGLRHCREAAKITPRFAEAHFNIGDGLLFLGNVNEAIAEYRKSLEIKPNFAAAHYHLGLAFAKLGRFDDAVASYHRALELNPPFAADVQTCIRAALMARSWSETPASPQPRKPSTGTEAPRH